MDKLMTMTDCLAQTEQIDAVVAEAMPWIRWQAAEELSRRSGRLVFYSMGDYENLAGRETWLARRHRASGEEDYRRGYWHGYSQAMDDIEAEFKKRRGFKAAWQALAEFFDGALTHWRYRDRPGSLVPPPSATTARRAA